MLSLTSLAFDTFAHIVADMGSQTLVKKMLVNREIRQWVEQILLLQRTDLVALTFQRKSLRALTTNFLPKLSPQTRSHYLLQLISESSFSSGDAAESCWELILAALQPTSAVSRVTEMVRELVNFYLPLLSALPPGNQSDSQSPAKPKSDITVKSSDYIFAGFFLNIQQLDSDTFNRLQQFVLYGFSGGANLADVYLQRQQALYTLIQHPLFISTSLKKIIAILITDLQAYDALTQNTLKLLHFIIKFYVLEPESILAIHRVLYTLSEKLTKKTACQLNLLLPNFIQQPHFDPILLDSILVILLNLTKNFTRRNLAFFLEPIWALLKQFPQFESATISFGEMKSILLDSLAVPAYRHPADLITKLLNLIKLSVANDAILTIRIPCTLIERLGQANSQQNLKNHPFKGLEAFITWSQQKLAAPHYLVLPPLAEETFPVDVISLNQRLDQIVQCAPREFSRRWFNFLDDPRYIQLDIDVFRQALAKLLDDYKDFENTQSLDVVIYALSQLGLIIDHSLIMDMLQHFQQNPEKLTELGRQSLENPLAPIIVEMLKKLLQHSSLPQFHLQLVDCLAQKSGYAEGYEPAKINPADRRQRYYKIFRHLLTHPRLDAGALRPIQVVLLDYWLNAGSRINMSVRSSLWNALTELANHPASEIPAQFPDADSLREGLQADDLYVREQSCWWLCYLSLYSNLIPTIFDEVKVAQLLECYFCDTAGKVREAAKLVICSLIACPELDVSSFIRQLKLVFARLPNQQSLAMTVQSCFIHALQAVAATQGCSSAMLKACWGMVSNKNSLMHLLSVADVISERYPTLLAAVPYEVLHNLLLSYFTETQQFPPYEILAAQAALPYFIRHPAVTTASLMQLQTVILFKRPYHPSYNLLIDLIQHPLYSETAAKNLEAYIVDLSTRQFLIDQHTNPSILYLLIELSKKLPSPDLTIQIFLIMLANNDRSPNGFIESCKGFQYLIYLLLAKKLSDEPFGLENAISSTPFGKAFGSLFQLTKDNPAEFLSAQIPPCRKIG